MRLILVYRMAVALLLGTAVGVPASAHDYAAGGLKIIHPWARATPAGAKIGAGYLTMVNNSDQPDRLLGATTDAAERIEIHETTTVDGTSRMRAVSGGVDIPASKTVELQPGRLHLMLVNLRQPLVQGQRVKSILHFEKAGAVEVELDVSRAGAPSSVPTGQHSGH